MICCVGPCSNPAVVAVTFVRQTRAYPYCRFHAYRPHGDLRWSLAFVARVEQLEEDR